MFNIKKHNIHDDSFGKKLIYISLPRDFPISINNLKYLLGYPPLGYQYEVYYEYQIKPTQLNSNLSFNQMLNISQNLAKKGISNQLISLGNSYQISIDKMNLQKIEIDSGLSDAMDQDVILKDIFGQGFMSKQNKYLLESSKAYIKSSNLINYDLYQKKDGYFLKNTTKVIKGVNIYGDDSNNVYNAIELSATLENKIATLLDFIGLGKKYYSNLDINQIMTAANGVKNKVSINTLVNDQNEVTIHLENKQKKYNLNQIIINNSIGWVDKIKIYFLTWLNPNISANELNKNTSKRCHVTHVEKDFYDKDRFNLYVVCMTDLDVYHDFIKNINIISNYSIEHNQKIKQALSSKIFLPSEYINLLTGVYQHISGHKNLTPDLDGHSLNLMIPNAKKEIMINSNNIINRFGSKGGKIYLDIFQEHLIKYNMLSNVKLSYLSAVMNNKDIQNPAKLIKNLGFGPRCDIQKGLIVSGLINYLTFGAMWSGFKPLLLLNKFNDVFNYTWNKNREKVLLDASNCNLNYSHRVSLGANADLTLNVEINSNNNIHYIKYKDLSKKLSEQLSDRITDMEKKSNSDPDVLSKLKNRKNKVKTSKEFFRTMMNSNKKYQNLVNLLSDGNADPKDINEQIDECKDTDQIFFKPQLLCFLKFSYRLINTSFFNSEFNIKNQFNQNTNNTPEIYLESTLDFVLDRPNNRDLYSLSLYGAQIIQEKYSLKDHLFAHQYSFDEYKNILKFDKILGIQALHISPVLTTKKVIGQNLLGLYFASALNFSFMPHAKLKGTKDSKTQKFNNIFKSIMMCEVVIGIVLSILGVMNLMVCIYIGLDHEGKLQYDISFKRLNFIANQLNQKVLKL